jgi:ribosomal protein L11 methyltransferase
VRRVALTLRAEAVEGVLDVLMPLLPQGVYERAVDPERTELAFFGDELPAAGELDAIAGDALLGRDEEEVPDSREERRRRAGRAWTVAGRLRVRSPDDPPSTDGVQDVIIEPAPGAFGSGAHPTTRGCLELLLELEPGGGLADLGCGSGVVAIAAAQLGWAPVYALDFDQRSVAATERNAQSNGAEVRAVLADLREIPAPPANTLVANVPLEIHERVAGSLSPATAQVIVSGITASQEAAVTAAYGRAGLALRGRRVAGGWAALRLARG